jgi:GntR family transcriptional regulator
MVGTNLAAAGGLENLMNTPMYRQIAENLYEQIDSGILKPGAQLETETELQTRYNASRNTVRDAIKWLINLGLVETRAGQGTFVSKKVAPYVTTLTSNTQRSPGDVAVSGEGTTHPTQKLEKTNSDPQVEHKNARGIIAEQLRLGDGDKVVSRHQKRYIDNTPWSLQTSFYPRSLISQGASKLSDADNIDEGAVRYLTDAIGLRQVGYRDRITVRTPDLSEALFFNLPQDGRVSVIEIFRTAFDQGGNPMRLTITVFPADRNQFVVISGEVPDLDDGDNQEA